MIGEIEAVVDALNGHRFVTSLWEAWPSCCMDICEPRRILTLSFDFEVVYARALRVRLESSEAMVVSLDDLIALKRQVNRPRDQEDVAALEALKGETMQEGGPDE